MVRSEGNMSLKNPMIPPGIDPGTVRLVAQRLNHYAIPPEMVVTIIVTFYMFPNLGGFSLTYLLTYSLHAAQSFLRI